MSVLESTGPVDICTCSHPPECRHDCHDHRCDPAESVCSLEFRPDEGGMTHVGCDACTPGAGVAHLAGCPAIVAIPIDRPGDRLGDSVRL